MLFDTIQKCYYYCFATSKLPNWVITCRFIFFCLRFIKLTKLVIVKYIPHTMIKRVYAADELEVCEEVGRGGFGVVYRGVIRSNNQEVAIKQIDLENDQTNLLEINKEIQIISECRLSQITRYLGCFVKNYKLWVIMEFVNGGSLFELLKPGPVQDEGVISVIIKEILIALEYLHNQGKIHRDLKSQNILLSKQGDVKLTDFGVSTQLSSNFLRRNTTVGTPYWMAPEVILNNNGGHSFKADIWSLGCCAYEIFNAKPPLQNQYPPMKALRQISKCQREQDFINLIGMRDLDISSTFRDFLCKCFILDPKERYSSTKLLNHKFITKYESLPDKAKLLKKLITKKQVWDQENHIAKSQNFYIPTEIAQNQMKWNDVQQEAHKTFQFDISLIDCMNHYPPSPSSSKVSSRELSPHEGSPHEASPQKSSPESHPKPKLIINYQSLTKANTKQDQFKKQIKPEFHRILNKVFYKLETKNTLSTEQYDLLVALNDKLLSLLTFTNNTDPQDSSSKKVLVFQYLKYLLKEVIRNSNDNDTYATNPKMTLQRLIIPSNLTHSKQLQETLVLERPAPCARQFDEIEKSLVASWIDKMKEAQ